MWNIIKSIFSSSGRLNKLEEKIKQLETRIQELEELLEIRDEIFLENIFEHIVIPPEDILEEEMLGAFPSIFPENKDDKDN